MMALLQITSEYVSERILQLNQHWAQLWKKEYGGLYFDSRQKKLTLNCLHFHNFEKQQSNSYNQNINKLHGHNPPRVITHTHLLN